MFLAVGGLAYLVDVIGFNAALLLGSGHLASKVFSGLAGAAVAYVGNGYYTWPDHRRPSLPRLLVFVAVSGVATGVQLGCLWLSHDVFGLRDLVSDNVSANIVGMALATALRFWGFRRLVFRRPEPAGFRHRDRPSDRAVAMEGLPPVG